MRYRPARYQAFSAQRCNIDFLQDLWHWMFVLKDDRLVFVLTCLDTYQHRRNHIWRDHGRSNHELFRTVALNFEWGRLLQLRRAP